MTNYEVRQMRPDEMGLAIEWAAAEGWNPGLHDGDLFYETDPAGFFVGTLDGEPVACISAVAYDDGFGFIGFYIVRPEFRGQGYGIRIWERAMEYLGDRNMGLDGVLTSQGRYESVGFRLAYRNVRYLGRTRAEPPMPDDEIVLLQEVPFEAVARYDSALFPTSRDEFLARWVAQPDAVALGCVEGAVLRGFGVVRRCLDGFKIGPLLADNVNIAERLFRALEGQAVDGAPVYLDVPEPNAAGVRMAEMYKMQPVFETVRMYTGDAPDVDLGRVFGVTTFELG